jgi:ABC-type transport system involved in multi-copper enzyme maturation permease subunit
MVFFRDPDHINSGMAMISRTFLIVMALVTLQSAIKDEKLHLLERPVFWVVMGVVLYSAGTLLVVGLSNQLLELGVPYFVVAWHINWSLLIIANLLYTKGMLCKSQA